LQTFEIKYNLNGEIRFWRIDAENADNAIEKFKEDCGHEMEGDDHISIISCKPFYLRRNRLSRIEVFHCVFTERGDRIDIFGPEPSQAFKKETKAE
jgi:hypothetical protein